MGAYGMIGIGSLIGMGTSGMKKSQAAAPVSGGMMAAKPQAPVLPAVDTAGSETGRTANPLMEVERERERQAALLRMQQAPEIFTSGLGASGLADTSKKTLLGG